MIIRDYVRYPANLPGQFAIVPTERLRELPPHPFRDRWRRRTFAGLELFASDDLAIVECSFANGSPAGFFIGEPVDVERYNIVPQELEFRAPLASFESIDSWVEDQVYRFAGRFIFVLATTETARIYLDSGGLLPLVFDPELGIVGSTAAAIYGPQDFLTRLDFDLLQRLDLLGGGWIPAGLTAHRGLRRLVANFRLDLANWNAARHWPVAEIEQSTDPESTTFRIAEQIAATIRAYNNEGAVCAALTGGFETRLLLAISRPLRDQIEFVCFYHQRGGRDRLIAERVARTLGLSLRCLPFGRAGEEGASEWMARSGYCAGENRYLFEVTRRLSQFDFFLGGVAGEVGRGFFWRSTDAADMAFTAKDLLARMGQPHSPIVFEAVSEWFRTLPTSDPLLKMDLAYLELRVSCWAAVQAYSVVGPKHVYPMVSRQAFAGMLALPPSWRRDEKWLRVVIAKRWPEALSVPVNSLGPWRDRLLSLQRAVQNPRLVARKLRRKLA